MVFTMRSYGTLKVSLLVLGIAIGGWYFLTATTNLEQCVKLSQEPLKDAEIIAQEAAGDVHTRADEAERGITIKTTDISLFFEMTDESLASYKGGRDVNEYLINLNSPGHVGFSLEVTAALPITDGALVSVDCIEGVCVQTESVLRQALGDRNRPVLTLNKMDMCSPELQVQGREAYLSFSRATENANVVMAT